MTQPNRVVVVGGGLAGAKTVEALREQGYTGALTLVAAENEAPYERPPLSKGILLGNDEPGSSQVHDTAWYADQGIDLLLGTRALEVDAENHSVSLDTGAALGYDALVLATGSQPRTLPLPGADAENVRTLRYLPDCLAIKQSFGEGKRLVIIGGGWIGLEVAAAARNAGVEVTVLEAAELPLLAALGPELAKVFADLHAEHGVEVVTGAKVSGLTQTDGRVSSVELADGRSFPADDVLVGVGAAPAVELAESAGVAVDHGVLVDAGLRTSDPAIWAVGDIASVEHPFLHTRVRVEHWASALNQPAVAAATVLGTDRSFDELPYFYTDQYDLGMEYLGYVPAGTAAEVVIRGDLAGREFIAFWLDAEHHVLAGMNVNVWDVTDDVKALIQSRAQVDPQQLADPDVPLADLAG